MENLMRAVWFCAGECKRQKSGELSVPRMVDAWRYAMRMAEIGPPTVSVILELGKRIEPKLNSFGFRQTPIIFANGNKVAPHSTIPNAIARLVEHATIGKGAKEYYSGFQKIHPFADGNGRVGALIYNWHTLTNMSIPPNLF